MKKKTKKSDRIVYFAMIIAFIAIVRMLHWHITSLNEIAFSHVNNILVVTSKDYFYENSVYPSSMEEIVESFKDEYIKEDDDISKMLKNNSFNNYHRGAKYEITEYGIKSSYKKEVFSYEFKTDAED